MPGCVGTEAAERSYPTSEVRGSGWEEIPSIRDQGLWPRGATACLRAVAVAGRSNHTPEDRGGSREELPRVRGQWWPGRDTLRPRPGAVTLRSHPEPEAGREEHPEKW